MVSLSFSRRRPAGFFDLKLPGAFLRLLRKPEPLEQGLRADFLLQERGLDSFIGRHPVFPGPQELRRPVVNAAAEQQSDAPLSP